MFGLGAVGPGQHRDKWAGGYGTPVAGRSRRFRNRALAVGLGGSPRMYRRRAGAVALAASGTTTSRWARWRSCCPCCPPPCRWAG